VCTTVVMLCAMTSPGSQEDWPSKPMDTGLHPRLEALLVAHPDVTIGLSAETGQWEAVQRPTPTCVVISHAATLAELDAKLCGETP
jgi:hypothetical protein